MLIHENKEDLIMRKALALVLCGAMAVSMVGCGSSNSGGRRIYQESNGEAGNHWHHFIPYTVCHCTACRQGAVKRCSLWRVFP